MEAIFGMGIMVVLLLGVGVLGTIFWIWMLVDCATKEPSDGNEKLVWVVIIVLTHLLGAILYFFFRRPARIETYGR